MDGSRLHLGAGQLDSPSKTGGSLGCGPLGAPPRRLGLDCRPLAVKQQDSADGRLWEDTDPTPHLPPESNSDYQPKIFAKISGATIVASDSTMNFGVSMFSLPHVIFSLGTAPEYDPKLVVESLI
jgi:hypothetical protein